MTPENAELLAKYAGQLERLPLTRHSPRTYLRAVRAFLSASRRSPLGPARAPHEPGRDGGDGGLRQGDRGSFRSGAGLALREQDELPALLRPCFARTERWLQAGKYVSALVSELPRVNGWSIARHGRDRTPDRTQRLLNHASWDTFAAMSVVRRFAVKGLQEAARRGRRGGMVIGATGETGQEKPARPPRA
jgi:hypothetical protein